MMTPCSVRMSCLVASQAMKDVAQVDLHDAALLRRAEELDLLQFALEIGEERLDLLLGRRRRTPRRLGARAAGAGALEPFVGDDHHRLRQIERGEGRIDRQRDDAVGHADLVVLQPVALAAEHQRHRLAGGNARPHLDAPPPRPRQPAWPGRGCAPSWPARRCSRRPPRPGSRTATASSRMRSAPAAITTARSFGQPCFGLTSRNRASPKLAMARAAAPILSPSCVSTSTTTGAGCSIQRLVLSVPAPGIEGSPLPGGIAAPFTAGKVAALCACEQGFYQRGADAIGRAPTPVSRRPEVQACPNLEIMWTKVDEAPGACDVTRCCRSSRPSSARPACR